jgi:hypothetical protein
LFEPLLLEPDAGSRATLAHGVDCRGGARVRRIHWPAGNQDDGSTQLKRFAGVGQQTLIGGGPALPFKSEALLPLSSCREVGTPSAMLRETLSATATLRPCTWQFNVAISSPPCRWNYCS